MNLENRIVSLTLLYRLSNKRFGHFLALFIENEVGLLAAVFDPPENGVLKGLPHQRFKCRVFSHLLPRKGTETIIPYSNVPR